MSNLSTEYANDLFESIARITQSEIDKNNKFDTTEIYTITRIVEDDYDAYEIAKEIKEETTTSNAPKIKAYAQNGEKYAVGDNVYVLTPGNDSTARKAIIGKAAAAKANEKVPYVTLKDQIIIFKENESDIRNFIPKYVVTTDGLGFFEGDFVVGSSGKFRQTMNIYKDDSFYKKDEQNNIIDNEEAIEEYRINNNGELPLVNKEEYTGAIYYQYYDFDNYATETLEWLFRDMVGDYRYEQIQSNYQEKLWNNKFLPHFNSHEIPSFTQVYHGYSNVEISEMKHFAGLTQNTFQQEGLFITSNQPKQYSNNNDKEVILEAYWIQKDEDKGIFIRNKGENFISNFETSIIGNYNFSVTFDNGAFAEMQLVSEKDFYKEDTYEIFIPLRMIKGEDIDTNLKIFLYKDSEYKNFFDGSILKTEIVEYNTTTGQYCLKIRFQANTDIKSDLYIKILDFDRDIFNFLDTDTGLNKEITIRPLLQQITWYKYYKDSSDAWTEISTNDNEPFKITVNLDTSFDSQTFKCVIKNDKEDKQPISLEIPFVNTSINTENKETGASQEIKENGETGDYRIGTEDPDSEINAYVRDGNYWVYGEDNLVLDNADSQTRKLTIIPKEKMQVYGVTWQIPCGNTMFETNDPVGGTDMVYEFNKAHVSKIENQTDINKIFLTFDDYNNFDTSTTGLYRITLYKDQTKTENLSVNLINTHIVDASTVAFGIKEVPAWLAASEEKNYYATLKEPENSNNKWEKTTTWNPSAADIYYTTYRYKDNIKPITDLASLGLSFQISNQYYPSRTFNKLFCEIWRSPREKATISKTLQFGKQEVQGSKYRFNLVFENERPILYNEYNISVKPVLENDHGIKLNKDCDITLYTPFAKDSALMEAKNVKTNQSHQFVLSGNDLGGYITENGKQVASNISKNWRVVYAVAKVTIDDTVLEAWLSIPTVQYDANWTDEAYPSPGGITERSVWSVSGPREVIYSGSGQNPILSKDPYAIYNKNGKRLDINDDTHTNIKGSFEATFEGLMDGKKLTGSNTNLSREMLVQKDGDYYLSPPSVFLETLSESRSIKLFMYRRPGPTYRDWCVVVVPVFFRRNLYENSLLNEWDGAFGVNNNNAFYANVAVGEKDYTNNTFTGVLMGKDNKTDNPIYGLFGYEEGNNIFRVTNKGEIFIGKDNSWLHFQAADTNSSLQIRTSDFRVGNNNWFISGNSSGDINIKAKKFELNAEHLKLTSNLSDTNTNQIGNWKLTPNKLYYPKTLGNDDGYSTGIASTGVDDNAAFWAGYNGYGREPFQHAEGKQKDSWMNHTNFYVLNNGKLKATWGEIAGFVFNSSALYKGTKSLTSKTEGVYVGIDGIRAVDLYGSSMTIQGSSINFLSDQGTKINMHGNAIELHDDGTVNSWTPCSMEFYLGNKLYGEISGVWGISGANSDFHLDWEGNFIGNYGEFYGDVFIYKDLYTYEGLYSEGQINSSESIITDKSLICGAYVRPNADKAASVGSSNYRWNNIYAASSTINTSDRNVKDNILKLTDIHKQLFMKLIPVSFTFVDGTSGRTHIGFISQDVENAMTELGMTSLDFAGFCKDLKTKPHVDENGTEIEVPDLDEYGNEQYLYALRYEEFIAIITYVLQDTVQKLNAFEQRLLKIENINS